MHAQVGTLSLVPYVPDPILLAADPEQTADLPAAIEIFREARRTDPQADVRLVRMILPETGALGASASVRERVLNILDAVSASSKFIPQLMLLDRYGDDRTRARITTLVARHHRNREWIEERLVDPCSRVRANLVEAFLGESSPEAMEVFRRGIRDTTRRVLANSALGLYLGGSTEGLPILGDRLANNSDPLDRAAAGWAIGRTRDSRFLPILARLVRDDEPGVRRQAFRAIAAIRQGRASTAASCEVHFLKVNRVKESSMHLLFSACTAETKEPIRRLKPLDARILFNGEAVLEYRFQERVKHADPGVYDLHFVANLARPGKVVDAPAKLMTKIELTISNSQYFGTHASYWFGS
jgi:hypothetical protein